LGYSPIHFFVLSFLSSKKINKKINYYKKNITVRRGCHNALKMVKNWLRRFKNIKIKI
jgi:hypothetical protein